MHASRKMLPLLGLTTLAALGFSALPAHAQYNIGGVIYTPSQPQENLSATFTAPDGGVTTNGYSGYVLVNVSGTGQSYGTIDNDAFYLYDGQFTGSPTNGYDGGYYQLTFSTQPLVAFSPGSDAENSIVGNVPAYNPLHEYSFILNTGLSAPGQLHFGVSDGGYGDNTGAYQISVEQLATPEPAPTAAVGFGAFILGVLILRARKKTLSA